MQFTTSSDGWAEASPFAPEVLTVDQAADQRRRRPSSQPEMRLMLAVIEEAVVTYRRFALDDEGRGRRRFEEVERWIQSTDTSWLYSFESICDVLGVEPEALRHALSAWRAKRLRREAPAERARRWRRVAGPRHSITF